MWDEILTVVSGVFMIGGVVVIGLVVRALWRDRHGGVS